MAALLQTEILLFPVYASPIGIYYYSLHHLKKWEFKRLDINYHSHFE
jgi:hypothetical protein